MTADRDTTLATIERLLRAGQMPAAKESVQALARRSAEERNALVELADRLGESHTTAAALCVEAAADAWAEQGEFATAAAVLQEFSLRVPGQIPALLRLVEICVEGGLETAMNEAQAQLVDAYLDAGRSDEARVVAEDLAALQPADPAHQERLKRARRMAAPAVSTATGNEVDLTNLLDDGEAGEPDATEADTTVEPLELGRTYLEMDMHDEAIGPLEVAAHSPLTRFEASAALARVYRERGDLPVAIEWYERAAAAVAPSSEASRALMYDLGEVLERSGEGARALAVFMEIDAAGPGYRDVADRVKRLTSTDEGG